MARNVWKYILSILTLFSLIFLLRNITTEQKWRNHILAPLYKVQNRIQSSNLSGSLPTFHRSCSFCPHLGQPTSLEEELEERNLLDSIDWPQPPSGSAPPALTKTSDPAHSLFKIVPSQNGQRWYVGDQLEVQVHLHDFEGRPKRYGGDFLLARLHSPKCKAGVAGQLLDHKNGLYSARFPLLWDGSAQVEVTMVHSSEAVAVLRRLREKRPDRVYFFSFFRRGNHSEKMLCNVCLPQDEGPLCNFTDPHSGDQWFCYKPKMLSCDARYSHSMGGYAKNLITEKEALLFKRGKNVKVAIHASTTDTINVLPARNGSSSQKPDPVKLATSGYYYQDSWRPLGGVTMRQFDTPSAITQCLTNKLVYMYGDSTLRQWFEFLLTVLPDMKKLNLENPKKSGPFMAVDSTRNILLEYRFHGPPIRIQPVMVSELRYIANELDGLTGGPNTVVVLGIWAHFSTFPVEVYMHRLRHIRKAVARLLDRARETVVVIRTANPQEPGRAGNVYNSDWLMLQQDAVLRSMFKGLDVMLVDAWQMCLAHRLPHNLHPPRAIVKDMVDMMLSYVCRNGTRD
ncbi:NXPE family member 3-like isoform X1 [Phyllopteryx taeniolatus]|uniref:NXPE family member 3-like isoform X1 n=1 Tax=Phyllopteryx taeniolatus TaxID=161469 RepID=UPI002AD3E8E5|nr:NXPE family member 3-like isoform X1 [Phyllopteryx taeniolatus]XP_061649068.1 NXPE family member 3-like isoform X1 [Phyllopteryx taeniolatus]